LHGLVRNIYFNVLPNIQLIFAKEEKLMNYHKGSLVCVGTGMRLGGQLTPIAKSHIENADIVMAAVANHLTINLVKSMSKAFVRFLWLRPW
jgi:hypothetical protein